MRGCRAVSRTIKSMSKSKPLYLSPFKAKPQKEMSHFVALLPRVSCAATALGGISISTRARARVCLCVCVKYSNEIVARLFCFVQTNKICITWMLFGALLINTRACFYENSPKRRLVNLSDIISKVGGVIDCGSDGERKSGRPDINIPCQFSICLVVTNSCCSGRLSANTRFFFTQHFSLFLPHWSGVTFFDKYENILQ